MAVEIITREDLELFGKKLLQDITEFVKGKNSAQTEWLKSKDIRKMLGCSAGTLQNLRVKGMPFTKMGGTLYYKYEDVMKMMEVNKRNGNELITRTTMKENHLGLLGLDHLNLLTKK